MSKAKIARPLLSVVALQLSSLYAQDHSMDGTLVSGPEHRAQSPEITLGADGSVQFAWHQGSAVRTARWVNP
ncbi:MAG: hypothetical protein FJ160_04135 [Gammaproteobacteria bacterium]|nr:hypothetical protein [Gammaproteobacteria bacterium]